jgi:AcrR family transcriptional regulator
MKDPLNGQQSRSIATQMALMKAAEKLIAEKGIHNVSISQIVKEAGQKNESALQYHFKNLQGLINAIHHMRSDQTRLKRTELLN